MYKDNCWKIFHCNIKKWMYIQWDFRKYMRHDGIVSATSSCVASTSHVEISPVSSSSSSSSSSPGKLSVLSKQTWYNIFCSLICLMHSKKKFVMSTGKCLGSHLFTKHCQLCIWYKIGYFSLQYYYVTYNLHHFTICAMFYCNLHSN